MLIMRGTLLLLGLYDAVAFHDCVQPSKRMRGPHKMAMPATDPPAGCNGGLCLGMHGGPHEGGSSAYPVGNASQGFTSVHSTMTVPEPPVALDGITYYIWTDIFFGDASLGAMNQFVPQLVLGNALDGSSGAPAYTPHWGEHQTWAFGAHYFFETHNATTGATQGHAVCIYGRVHVCIWSRTYMVTFCMCMYGNVLMYRTTR